MKQALVNGRWNIWLPDNIADWDGITGDYTARRGWEFQRFESFRRNLRWGDCFYDIGTEHGWISGIIAREFVGAQHMVLMEPSPEFWVNIRKIWTWNNFEDPAGCWQGFLDETDGVAGNDGWPSCADATKPEIPGMAYRSLLNQTAIPSISVDNYARSTGLMPDALNIDVEGAELLVLRGAARSLESGRLSNVWVSVHPDLMLNFGHTPEMLHEFMVERGWVGEHLDTDHEQHHHFTRQR